MRATTYNLFNQAANNRSVRQPNPSRSLNRTSVPSPTIQACGRLIREYLRDVRAAEMRAWEMSGGDFLISG